MSYCTQQDLIDRFGADELIQLTDRAGTADAIDATVLGQAIADADALIDGYLAGRYALPLASTPTALERAACDVARYFLFGASVPDVVQRRYDDVVKFMMALAKGDVSLGMDGGGNEVAVDSTPEFSSAESVFQRGADW